MEQIVLLALMYLAIGAVLFAHPPEQGPDLEGFGWRGQLATFLTTLPEVLAWPLALWRFGRT